MLSISVLFMGLHYPLCHPNPNSTGNRQESISAACHRRSCARGRARASETEVRLVVTSCGRDRNWFRPKLWIDPRSGSCSEWILLPGPMPCLTNVQLARNTWLTITTSERVAQHDNDELQFTPGSVWAPNSNLDQGCRSPFPGRGGPGMVAREQAF